MSSTTERMLTEGTEGTLDLGIGGSAPCRVTGFAGRRVFLQVHAAATTTEGVAAGYLLLEDGGRMQALRGRVESVGEGAAVLVLTDAFDGQRRLFSRAPLVLRARLCADEGAGLPTFTRDLSAGGVAVDRPDGWDGRVGCAMEIELAPRVTVQAHAHVVRDGGGELGLRFTEIDTEDRGMLAELALAYHRAP
jgi:hypothetical protein